MILAVKRTFLAFASSLSLCWEMAASQTEAIHGLDKSPGQLLDHITLEGTGKAGVVKYYQSLPSALYIESYIFQISFHTQRACMKEIVHIFHSHWGKKKEKITTSMKENSPPGMSTVFIEVTIKNLDLELCMGLIHCNLLCVCVYVCLNTIISPLNKILFCMDNSRQLSCRKKH